MILLENKDDDSCRNSEDNFSPDTYRGCYLSIKKISNLLFELLI